MRTRVSHETQNKHVAIPEDGLSENHPETTVEWQLASSSGAEALAFKQQEGIQMALLEPLSLLSLPSVVLWHSKPLSAPPSIFYPFLLWIQSLITYKVNRVRHQQNTIHMQIYLKSHM